MERAMRFLAQLALAATLALGAGAGPAAAAELLMFEEDGCVWCLKWEREVGVVYMKTPEGKRAPLHRIDIRQALPEGLSLSSRPRFTPTFVLIEEGKEIGRIEGYPGEDFFWALLNRLLGELPSPGVVIQAEVASR